MLQQLFNLLSVVNFTARLWQPLQASCKRVVNMFGITSLLSIYTFSNLLSCIRCSTVKMTLNIFIKNCTGSAVLSRREWMARPRAVWLQEQSHHRVSTLNKTQTLLIALQTSDCLWLCFKRPLDTPRKHTNQTEKHSYRHKKKNPSQSAGRLC